MTVDDHGRAIEVWTARPTTIGDREPEAFILEFTGNATRAEEIAQYVAQRWQAHPVEAWVMNYPGYGGSEGGAKIRLIPPAALATFDELHRRANGRPISLEANSLGTAAALYVASQREVAGLVLQNPPPLRRLILQHYGWWNLWMVAGPFALQIPKELDATHTAPLVTEPAIFMLADKDTTVPAKYHDIVVNAYAGPKAVIHMPSLGHNDSITGEADVQLHQAIDRMWNQTFATRQA